MSNLNNARSLIQADLDHARNVRDLWTNQVGELERALEQLEAVGKSRNALHVEYRVTGSQSLGLDKPASKTGNKRGRKPKNVIESDDNKQGKGKVDIKTRRSSKLAERTAAALGKVVTAKTAKTPKAKTSKTKATPEPKFKDPNSDKTWSGRGRRPFWMSGSDDQYLISSLPQGGAAAATTSAVAPAA